MRPRHGPLCAPAHPPSCHRPVGELHGCKARRHEQAGGRRRERTYEGHEVERERRERRPHERDQVQQRVRDALAHVPHELPEHKRGATPTEHGTLHLLREPVVERGEQDLREQRAADVARDEQHGAQHEPERAPREQGRSGLWRLPDRREPRGGTGHQERRGGHEARDVQGRGDQRVAPVSGVRAQVAERGERGAEAVRKPQRRGGRSGRNGGRGRCRSTRHEGRVRHAGPACLHSLLFSSRPGA